MQEDLNTGTLQIPVPYSTYYKPMGDLLYISSEQGSGLIIHDRLIIRIPYISVIYLYRVYEGGGLIIHHGLIIRTIR